MTNLNITLIGTVPKGHCLSALDENQRRRLLAFADRKDAAKCIRYISTFRSRFGYWPECDLSQKVPVELKEVENFKQRSIEDVEKFFYMMEENEKNVKINEQLEECTTEEIPYSEEVTSAPPQEFTLLIKFYYEGKPLTDIA